MDTFKFVKKILIAGLMFFAQKTWANTQTHALYGMPSQFLPATSSAPSAPIIPPEIATSTTPLIPMLDNAVPFSWADYIRHAGFGLALTVLVVMGAIILPIVGFRWYMKHGGTKKWIKWFIYAPLIGVGVAILYIIMILLSR